MNEEEKKAYDNYVATMGFVSLLLAGAGIALVGYMVYLVLQNVVELLNY